MKQCYLTLVLFPALFTLIIFLPVFVYGQCTCANGQPAKTQEQLVNKTNFPSGIPQTISVRQFDASKGTLVCVSAKVFLTSVVRMHFENYEDVPVRYTVHYDRSDTLSGPGIVPPVTGVTNRSYGPYDLGASDGQYFYGPDYVFIGPDTVYNKKIYEGTTTSVAGYIGAGTVDFKYTAKVATYATGRDLWNLFVDGRNQMDFTLTYSYCDNATLPIGVIDFQVRLIDQRNVALSWTDPNESKHNNYEIERSQDGTQFETLGPPQHQSADGTATKYYHQYHLDQPLDGKLYFRLRQVNGKSIEYSEIRGVSAGAAANAALRVMPNPVSSYMKLDFGAPVSGEYLVDLVSPSGRLVQSSRLQVSGGTAVHVVISGAPPPGLYFLRAREAATGRLYAGKVILRN